MPCYQSVYFGRQSRTAFTDAVPESDNAPKPVVGILFSAKKEEERVFRERIPQYVAETTAVKSAKVE